MAFLSLLLAGLAEGLGLTTLLPLFTLAANQGDAGLAGLGDSGAGQLVTGILQALHLSPTLTTLLAVIVFGLLLKAVMTLLAYRQVGYTVASIATDLRLDLLRALSRSRWEYFLKQRAGGLANAVATEATRSARAFQSGVTVIALFTHALIFLGVAFLLDWQAALAAIALGLFLLLALGFLVRMARRAGERQQRLFRSLLALLTDSLRSLKPLKAMAREGEIDYLLERDTRRLNRAMRKDVLSKEALKAIQELVIGIVLVTGAFLALSRWHMGLAAVMTLIVVIARLLTKVSKLQQEYQKLATCQSFYRSLQAAIAQAHAAQEYAYGTQTALLNAAVRLRDVSFGYAERQVLNRVSLEFRLGQLSVITGASGAGKTTVVDLVIGLLRADSGAVLIDDTPLEQLDIRRWRSTIGYVPQDTVLLHDSIINNVTIGDPSLTEEDALWALRRAGAWDFVRQLAQRQHTVVGESGGSLSGGQRQRIVLARALVHKPRLLILDEATSALDDQTERAVCDTLQALGPDYCIIAITHRETLLEVADVVYRIENGRVLPSKAVAAL